MPERAKDGLLVLRHEIAPDKQHRQVSVMPEVGQVQVKPAGLGPHNQIPSFRSCPGRGTFSPLLVTSCRVAHFFIDTFPMPCRFFASGENNRQSLVFQAIIETFDDFILKINYPRLLLPPVRDPIVAGVDGRQINSYVRTS
jgi:hypothetical protein